jgi:hypothetical protein
MAYLVTYNGPTKPTFRCGHFQIGGVNAASCKVCGLLAPSEHHLLRVESVPGLTP